MRRGGPLVSSGPEPLASLAGAWGGRDGTGRLGERGRIISLVILLILNGEAIGNGIGSKTI